MLCNRGDKEEQEGELSHPYNAISEWARAPLSVRTECAEALLFLKRTALRQAQGEREIGGAWSVLLQIHIHATIDQ